MRKRRAALRPLAIALAVLLQAACSGDSGIAMDPPPDGDPSSSAPVITRFQPLFPGTGETLTIEGRNFGNRLDRVRVTVNGAAASVVAVEDDRIRAVAPPPAGRAPTTVVVIVNGLRSLPFGVLAE